MTLNSEIHEGFEMKMIINPDRNKRKEQKINTRSERVKLTFFRNVCKNVQTLSSEL